MPNEGMVRRMLHMTREQHGMSVDEKLLTALYRLHYLKLEQITRCLRYSGKSKNWLRVKLTRLEEKELVFSQPLPQTRKGEPFLVYELGTKGVEIFEKQGLEVFKFTPAERKRSLIFLPHTLRVNDVIIAASLLEPQGVTLAEFRHERNLKRHPLKLTVDNKIASLIPDIWMNLHHAGYQYPVFVEVDLGTEDALRIKSKVAAYSCLAEKIDVYKKEYGLDYFTVLWLTTTPLRLKQLKRWVSEELAARGKTEVFENYFTLLPDGEIDPRIFLDTVWQNTGSQELVAFI